MFQLNYSLFLPIFYILKSIFTFKNINWNKKKQTLEISASTLIQFLLYDRISFETFHLSSSLLEMLLSIHHAFLPLFYTLSSLVASPFLHSARSSRKEQKRGNFGLQIAPKSPECILEAILGLKWLWKPWKCTKKIRRHRSIEFAVQILMYFLRLFLYWRFFLLCLDFVFINSLLPRPKIRRGVY